MNVGKINDLFFKLKYEAHRRFRDYVGIVPSNKDPMEDIKIYERMERLERQILEQFRHELSIIMSEERYKLYTDAFMGKKKKK